MNDPAGLLRLSRQALAAGDAGAAEDWALQAVALAPAHAGAYAALGDAQLQGGELAPAEAAYRKALDLDADCHAAHLGLWAWFKLAGVRPQMVERYKAALLAADEGGPPRGEASSPSLHLPDVALCCIDTNSHGLARRALAASLRQCRFGDALLLSDRAVDLPGLRHVAIPPLRSAAGYSSFVLRELHRHVRTPFVLIVQWDGYVVDAAAWSAQFLEYDYVGAPWPSAAPGGTPSVGNGGFSLRSRRLLAALADASFAPGHPEDEVICVRERARLEGEFGLRFAPPEVAERFAFEYGPRPPAGTFGFHGVMNMARFTAAQELKTLQALR